MHLISGGQNYFFGVLCAQNYCLKGAGSQDSHVRKNAV